MSTYRKTSPVPYIAGGLLLAAFVGIVAYYAGRGEQTAGTPNVPVAAAPSPVSVPAPEPEAAPPREVPVAPPPRPALTAAQAETRLREATRSWRAFALQVCKKERWKSERAVAFLQKVTWNDRDLEKQHAQGLASIRAMLGTETDDPVALATALEEKGTLETFFVHNWSKVAADWTPQAKVTVLEDKWKPNRIRWGFPLDAPVEKLQEFQNVGLRVALEMWRAVAGGYINALEIDDGAKGTRWQAAIGNGLKVQEQKMRAGLGVLLEMPEGTVKEVVEALLAKVQEQGQEEFAKAIAARLDAAVTAAEKAETDE